MRRKLKTSWESSIDDAQEIADQFGKPAYVFFENGMVNTVQEGLGTIPDDAVKITPKVAQHG